MFRLILIALLPLALWSCAHDTALYPGGETPPAMPRLLAPGLVNTGLITRDAAMTPDGGEFYFAQATAGYGQGAILVTRRSGGRWSDPEVVSFSGHPDWVDLEPCVSPDGRRLFFYSSRPAVPGGEPAQDIWVAERQGDGWGPPRNLGAPVNTEAPEYFPSVTADGTLYFCRADPATRVHTLYRARPDGAAFAEPEVLPAEANLGTNRFNAWVDPDESRMLIPAAGHPDNLGGVDYWLVRRDSDDRWSGPVNLGPAVNDGAPGSWSPYVSPDGAVFFFMSGRTTDPGPAWPRTWSGLQAGHRSAGSGRAGIFWMDAAFLDSLAAGRPAPEPVAAEASVPETAAGPAFPARSGPYLGQTPPGDVPELFAPDLVSTGLTERDLHVSADGREIRFGLMDLGLVTVLETRLEDGVWTEPVTAAFHPDDDFVCFEPTFSADGNTVLFLTNRAAPGQTQGRGWANQNIFRSVRRDGAWSAPTALPAPVTTDRAEYFPSLTADGTLYFSREGEDGHPALWRAERSTDGFAEPERLPGTVNCGPDVYNGFVSSDESLLIFCVAGHERNLGRADYWISYRTADGGWTAARNLGPLFNGPETRASSASLSPDGKYVFFSATRPAGESALPDPYTRADLHALHTEPGRGSSDIWWVSATVLPGPNQGSE